MKKHKFLRIFLPGCLLPLLFLAGCFADPQPRTSTDDTKSLTEPDQTDRIAALEHQLESLSTEWKKQNDAYEARIRKLERSASESETPTITPDYSDFTYEPNDSGITITGWNGSGKTLSIPQTINGNPVTAIGDGAFRGKELERVTLPDGIVSVGWFAFSGCYRLVSVTVPATVETIGYGAFEHCASGLCLICPSGSYAARYAASYGIPAGSQ